LIALEAGMAVWKDVPEEIKKRFPPPPERNKFTSDEEFQEARGYWQNRVGRNLGMIMQQYNAKKLRECERHAKMLVPKFFCQDENGLHIQWPKDDPKVVYATSEEELIKVLAQRLFELGRFSNRGSHVKSKISCPTC